MGASSCWQRSDLFWLRADCESVGSCTLAVGCGLLSFLFFCSLFVLFFSSSPFDPPSLDVAFLQGVAQDFMLSCNHRLTLSLFPVFAMWLKSPAATLQPFPLPVSLSRSSALLLYFCCRYYIHFFFFYFIFGGSILCVLHLTCILFF